MLQSHLSKIFHYEFEEHNVAASLQFHGIDVGAEIFF
jgi:hypothetical protein